jgi:serine/threonine-protein kinase
LQHPNIVQVFDIGLCAGRPYLALEFCEGGSLADRLKGAPPPPVAAAGLVETIAYAIQAAHDQGVVHRDLKPANILLDQSGTPKVSDFGLAKRLDEAGQTASGAVLGTSSYMAPEQAAGRAKEVGPAADVYALGAILYEALTGRPPFRAATALDTLRQVLQSDPVPPRLVNEALDRDIEAICLKCLHKRPEGRYASARELAADLDRYRRGEPVTARSYNVAATVGRALGHTRLGPELAEWGAVLLWWSGIVFLAYMSAGACMLTRQPAPWVLGCYLAQLGLMGVVLWRRGPGLLFRHQAMRDLRALWVGFLAAVAVTGAAFHHLYGLDEMYRMRDYPFYATLSGLAFAAVGSGYWGRCHLFGLSFLALALLMLANLRWAAFEFGIAWAVALASIGHHLRRLGRERPGVT